MEDYDAKIAVAMEFYAVRGDLRPFVNESLTSAVFAAIFARVLRELRLQKYYLVLDWTKRVSLRRLLLK